MVCTECNKEISKKAKICPYCGYKLRKGCGKVTTIVLIILLIIISIISIHNIITPSLHLNCIKIIYKLQLVKEKKFNLMNFF